MADDNSFLYTMQTTESVISNTTSSPSEGKLISDEAVRVFILVNFVVFYTLIGLCGIVTNIINIYVFTKMRTRDSVNLGLLALSVSDLGFLVSLVWLSIYYYPAWKSADIGYDPLDIKQMTASPLIFYFKNVSAWITAFITFERCVCIVLPFRAKRIMNFKLALCVIVTIFILMIVTQAPKFFACYFEEVFDPVKNKTSMKLVNAENYEQITETVSGMNTAFSLVTYVLVITCTSIMIISLRSNRIKRLVSARAEKLEQISIRDRKLVRTIFFLALIFLISFLPETILLATMALEPEVSYKGRYNNVFLVMVGVSETLLAINASVNISVYLKCSAKYKNTFLKIMMNSPLCLSLVSKVGDIKQYLSSESRSPKEQTGQ